MAKLLKREVMRAHDEWAMAAARWGENNLETVRKHGAYWQLREQWEQENGRPLFAAGGQR